MGGTPEELRAMSGERLRKEARRADSALGAELDRMQIQDARFRSALHHVINVGEEVDRRKGGEP